MARSKTTVLLADDHGVVRQGCVAILKADDTIEVVGQASNGRETLELSHRLKPHVVLLDIKMPELNGIEATRRIRKELPHTKVLALSMYKDEVFVRETIKAGAAGYLLKDCTSEELLTAVRAVAAGEGYLSPAVSPAVFEDYRRHVTNPIDLLSSREREILQLLAEGSSNKEIAGSLNISVYTVDAHRGRIMEKLNVHSIGGLVRFAMRNGLID